VYGYASATAGLAYGVLGKSASAGGSGVVGKAVATTGTTYGVHGLSLSTDGVGVYGQSDWRGIYGMSSHSTGVGVFAEASATSGDARAVFAESKSSEGQGVCGYASATSGATRGVYGRSNSHSGYGVYGLATDTTPVAYNHGGYFESYSGWGTGAYGKGGAYGVRGESSNYGVYGEATGTGLVHGGYFDGDSPVGYGVHAQGGQCGVYGLATATTGTNYGLRAMSWSSSGYAGYFDGDVHVAGNLSKSSGTFLIDHPLDPENRLLRHNFVESPENLLIYRGVVQLDAQGEASVELPNYFIALAVEGDASIQLTPLRVPFVTAYEWGSGFDQFTIRGESNREVSWMVLAERDDPVIRRLARPVEEEKGPDNKYCDRGKLLDPVAYGYPESMGRDYERHKSVRGRIGQKSD
jgi:hypothetical protein